MIISPKLVSTLLVAISQMTGYSIPGEPPRIRPMAQASLAEEVCGRPCSVRAFTTPNGDILIDESLVIGRDAAATSILVHELTHFLQVKSAASAVALTCDLWNEREREAYDVQYRWLREQSLTIRVFSFEAARLVVNPLLANCADGPMRSNAITLPTGG